MDGESIAIVLTMFLVLLLIFVGIYIANSRSHRCPNCGKKEALRETGRANEDQSKTYRELKCEFCGHTVIRDIRQSSDGGGCGGCGG